MEQLVFSREVCLMTDNKDKQLLLDDVSIDQRATAKKVRTFLKNKFERWLGYAGLDPVSLSVVDDTHLSSPKMDASGVAGGGGTNHQEDSTLRIIEAEKACYAVVDAMHHCQHTPSYPYRTIMIECYLRGTNDLSVAGLTNTSPSWFEILKRRAECNFADCWDKYKAKYDVGYLDDLHVYLKNVVDR